MKKILRHILLLIASLISCHAYATCNTDEYKHFDFWVGEWVVHTKAGKLAGHNTITKDYAGCVIKESYTTPGAYRGESLNSFDKSTQQWHQTWMDIGGLVLKLDGNWNGTSMVMQGSTKGQNGKLINRITWTPQKDGSVHQVWDTSNDDGKTWKNAFYGIYTKVPTDKKGSDKKSTDKKHTKQ